MNFKQNVEIYIYTRGGLKHKYIQSKRKKCRFDVSVSFNLLLITSGAIHKGVPLPAVITVLIILASPKSQIFTISQSCESKMLKKKKKENWTSLEGFLWQFNKDFVRGDNNGCSSEYNEVKLQGTQLKRGTFFPIWKFL